MGTGSRAEPLTRKPNQHSNQQKKPCTSKAPELPKPEARGRFSLAYLSAQCYNKHKEKALPVNGQPSGKRIRMTA